MMAWLIFEHCGVCADWGMSLVCGTVARTGFAFTTAADDRTDWTVGISESRTVPPAEPRYSTKSQVSASYEAPCQTKPYLTKPLLLSMTASLSSCSQTLGTLRCSLASRSFR